MKEKKKKRKTFILAIEGDDPENELEFELDFQATLTTRYGRRKPTSILKRT